MYIIVLYTLNYYEWHKFFFQIQIQYFKENLCSEMYFLKEQFIQNLQLLNSVAAALYFHDS